jgi:flagellar biosynthesis chaperone FliJ
MRQLNFELHKLQRQAKDGSFGTQAARAAILNQAANTLHDLGFRRMSATSLKRKHVDALITHWRKNSLGVGTMKNRMAHVRWWANKVGKSTAVANSNDVYGIPHRAYVTNTDKSRSLDERVNLVKDAHVTFSLKLQEAFGLRREESIKFQPGYADKGDRLLLKSTWTKGGKAREIPIRNQDQRQLLDQVHQFAGRGALIPSNRNYIQQLKVYERNVANAGFDKLHGLRHNYAQTRYEEITGWNSPIQGGPLRKDLEGEQRDLDISARMIISKELGHERLEIVAVYLGS